LTFLSAILLQLANGIASQREPQVTRRRYFFSFLFSHSSFLYPLSSLLLYRASVFSRRGVLEVSVNAVSFKSAGLTCAADFICPIVLSPSGQIRLCLSDMVSASAGSRWLKKASSWLRSAGDWEDLLDRVQEDRRQRYETGRGSRIGVAVPAQSGGFRALPVSQRTLASRREAIEQTGKPLLDGAQDIEMESIERVMEFSPMSVIDPIGPRPICIVTTARYDVTHPLEYIYEAYKRAQEPKKFVLLPLEQLDVYKEPGRSMALKEAVSWFDQHLRQK
jgi:hypothetical protein